MQITVDHLHDGKALINFIKSHHIPFSVIQKFLRSGRISVDGLVVSENIKLANGQVVFLDGYTVTPPDGKAAPTLDLSQHVIYECDDFLVIDKPAGLATQGGVFIKHCVDLYAKTNGMKLVHRLDKETSGVLLLAKTADAARALTAAFKERTIKKVYIAISYGSPTQKFGVVHLKIRELLVVNEERIVPDVDGVDSVTKYKILAESGELSLLELRPSTGRKHQLRVHCAHIGCPILGDKKYAPRVAQKGCKRLFLHALSITVPQSLFGQKVTIFARPPKEFSEKLGPGVDIEELV